MESKVWNGMLEFGKDKETEVTNLSEDSELLLMFLKVLDPKKWLIELPKELQNLQADSIISK